MDDEERLIIFCTEENLIHLKYNKIWICDGTFSVVPRNFTQLFRIQFSFKNKFMPLVFVLMKKKDTYSYSKVFSILKSHIDLQPSRIIIDFESASFKSLLLSFPNTQLSGCFFHFNQIFWRRLQLLNLSNIYKNCKNFKFYCKMILSLAFVPTF
jgi:predicted Ser/Thr protein kinase